MTLKNKYIHKKSPTSENLINNPKSNMYIEKILKHKNTRENLSFIFQHIHEIYKIKTTIPLMYTKIIKYFKYKILNICNRTKNMIKHTINRILNK
jgi:hypothetical protein